MGGPVHRHETGTLRVSASNVKGHNLPVQQGLGLGAGQSEHQPITVFTKLLAGLGLPGGRQASVS
jgi:hypothetical protein